MGSKVDDQDILTVQVTGFGPFREGYPVNPSWEIASRLPSHLPPQRAKDPSSRREPDDVIIPPVHIKVHPEPVRVNYQTVRQLVPQLWRSRDDDEGEGEVVCDVMLHIGMAGPQEKWQIERRGHRDGYKSRDVDGELLGDEDADGKHGEGWVWEGMPEVLETELDLEDVLRRWKGHSAKDANLLISEDAGHYLCDFIYYSSLSLLYKQGRPRKVVFLHVPANADEHLVQKGVDLAVNLIRSIAESETARKEDARR